MKTTLFALSVLAILLSSCKKDDEKPVTVTASPSYEQYYEVFVRNDSIYAYANFNKLLAKTDLLTMNGIPASINDTSNYYWITIGIKDLEFKLSKPGITVTNILKKAEIKTYTFVNLPDTVSISQWKSLNWTGPDRASDDHLGVSFNFSNGQNDVLVPATLTDNYVQFDASIINKMSPGEAKLSISFTRYYALQMQDGQMPGHIGCVTTAEKKIWLKP